MRHDDFIRSIREGSEPALSPSLRALWLDARGSWDAAHEAVQDDESREAAWVHAYLHRKEGDNGNARYWYARAQRTPSTASLSDEWDQIVAALLSSSDS
ncbi:MAG TPA: hypothetical protein VF190_09230 [Rhodothermales bacterium]